MNSLHNNLFVGKVCITLDEINSTNSYAKDLVSKNKPSEGTVIFARYQTDGKGQFGKTWESERGKSLTFSIILYPAFLQARRAHSLNQAMCLGLKDFIESLDIINVKIKWPNDIYCHDKKLAGLLIENGLMGEYLSYSVVGIGLNVNQTSFSSELPNPTSLKLISGKEFNMEILNEVFPFIEKRYLQLEACRFAEIKKDYINCLYNLNKKAIYKTSDGMLEGTIQGVNDLGQLVIETNGSTRCFNNSELMFQ